MIKELDTVVLTQDLPEYGLAAGDLGTVVLVLGGGVSYEVEFVTLGGETIALATLSSSQVRPAAPQEMPHARLLAT